jgi:hypothetical protein
MSGSRRLVAVVAVGAFAMTVACGKKGRVDYSESPDSGAVAPAMVQDTSLSRTYPDSTTGGPNRTGKRGVAGDTLSTRGQPVGTRMTGSDTANKAKSRPRP